MTSRPPPVNPAAAAANYTLRDESQGRITAIDANGLFVGTKKLVWNASTVIKVNTPKGTRTVIDSFVKAGMKIQWKGLRDPATGTVLLTKVEIN